MQAPALLALIFLLVPQANSVVPAGTPIHARLESAVQTATSNAGDVVNAVVVEPVRAGREIVVPKGSRLIGRVETVAAANSSREGRVRLAFREIRFPDGRSASTWITDSFSAPVPNRTRRHVLFVGIGATAGALIGGKAARVTGLIGGALAGFVIASNKNEGKLGNLSLKRGKVLKLQLGEELRVE